MKDYIFNLKNEGKLIIITSHIREDIAICDKVLKLENKTLTQGYIK